jgi:hypothetical protein
VGRLPVRSRSEAEAICRVQGGSRATGANASRRMSRRTHPRKYRLARVHANAVSRALQQPERLRQILERTPLGRVAEPEEVGAAIAFLCLPAASYAHRGRLARGLFRGVFDTLPRLCRRPGGATANAAPDPLALWAPTVEEGARAWRSSRPRSARIPRAAAGSISSRRFGRVLFCRKKFGSQGDARGPPRWIMTRKSHLTAR